MSELRIEPLQADPAIADALGHLLVETVAHGGSVSFMHPLPHDEARGFWEKSLAAAARGARIVLGAFDGDVLAGTVTLQLDCPPNQPHRAEIAKMMTRVDRRGRGIASALLREAERLAMKRGKTLLVLDTASDEGAAGLYRRMGYQLTGEIPDFALKPHGGLTGTLIFWKRLGSR
eukprot:gene22342-23472_t